MKNKLYWIAAGVGIVVGFFSAHSLFSSSWLALIFWALVGASIGLFTRDQRDVRWAGILYGFCLVAAFILGGFKGTSDKIPDLLILTLVFSISGALYGWLFVFIGGLCRRGVK